MRRRPTGVPTGRRIGRVSQPLVSVVVPVYNGEQFLAESLESVLAQTHTNLEVIVLDDASTDASATIGEEYAQRDGRVSFQQQPANDGQQLVQI